ncbi:M2 family metallopeptidase [Acidobacteriota bacterium]
MKRSFGLITVVVLIIGIIAFFPACGDKGEKSEEGNKVETTAQPAEMKAAEKEVDMELQKKAEDFLNKYLADYEKAYIAQGYTYWQAANSGKKEDFDAYAAADLEVKKLHNDSQLYAKVEELLKGKDNLKALTARSIELAELAFKENQLPKETLEKMSRMAADIEQAFNTFRGQLEGKEYSDNHLKEMLKEEMETPKRQKIWEALKQVCEAVAPKLVEFAKIRNEAAQKLGYKNYWDMQIRLQEHDPREILSIFAELETQTDEPFKKMKAKMDQELAARFKIKPEDMMPWHYDNPFFQEPPPSDKIDMDIFYKDKSKEAIIEITKKFFAGIDLPIDDIVARSDLYEREGKQQHAFCTCINRKDDTRVLVNVKPDAYWMDTVLHEMGHAIYCKYTDSNLPFNLRDSAHIFTTEAVAMLFGALAKTPLWIITNTGADEKKVKEAEEAILEQRRREQLLFARWSLVMLHFEKALYENPDQDLNTLWWDMVERFQVLKRPPGRNAPDWAAKIHFSIAPVYYHNYQLGELFAAQLRGTLVKLAKHEGPAHTLTYTGNKDFGNYFKEKIFQPGMTLRWPEFVKQATGEPLTAKYFAEEVK